MNEDELEDLYAEFESLSYKMDEEGTGYFFTGYTDSYSMPDEKSKLLFDKTKDAINEFEDYVNSKNEELEKQLRG